MRTTLQTKIAGKALTLSNVDKVLYPAAHFTKGQAIDYYQKVASVLLPHLKQRALTLKRYPNGVDAPFFYEKHCPKHRPDWIKTADIWSESNKADIPFCVIDSRPALVWVANLASLELHTSLARVDHPDRPTLLAFDLDPGPGATMADCVRVALQMREFLGHLSLESFPKTSGGKGLHFYVPLNTPAVTFEQTKRFAQSLALHMEHQDPKRITSVMKRSLREGKVFIDWSQNDRHKTTVSVYSLRAREHPTVSTPITWQEAERIKTRRDAAKLSFEADDVVKRIDKLGDLFAQVLKLKQKLPRLPDE